MLKESPSQNPGGWFFKLGNDISVCTSEIIHSLSYWTKSTHCHAERTLLIVMLNEVKHLYNKDSSLALRMTVSVIIYLGNDISVCTSEIIHSLSCWTKWSIFTIKILRCPFGSAQGWRLRMTVSVIIYIVTFIYPLNGVPPQVVMKWTGHSDYKAMRPFIDIAKKAKADAMKLIDDAWGM